MEAVKEAFRSAAVGRGTRPSLPASLLVLLCGILDDAHPRSGELKSNAPREAFEKDMLQQAASLVMRPKQGH